jgi:hypothetical protein
VIGTVALGRSTGLAGEWRHEKPGNQLEPGASCLHSGSPRVAFRQPSQRRIAPSRGRPGNVRTGRDAAETMVAVRPGAMRLRYLVPVAGVSAGEDGVESDRWIF